MRCLAGVHLFAVSSVQMPVGGGSDAVPVFHVCVAYSRSLSLYTFGSVPQRGRALVRTRDFMLPASCSVLAFCDRDRRLCVGFNTEFDMITIEQATITELYVGEARLQPVAAIPLDDDVLLCFNRMGGIDRDGGRPSALTQAPWGHADRGVFRDFQGRSSRDYMLSWTTIPTGVGTDLGQPICVCVCMCE